MINYSVAVRPNHGKDKDVNPKKAYAALQLSDVVTLDEFAAHIAEHGSVYNRGDIQAILCQSFDCLREMILEGKKVQLGDLGAFYPAIRSTGADTAAEFTAANITCLTVNWSRGTDLKNMVDEASFRLTTSRSVQNAAVAAQKAANGGDFSVNFSAGTGSGSSTTTPSGGGSSTTPSGGDTGSDGDDLGGNID